MNQKPCLAFLQNMWVRSPERVKLAIERQGEEYRRRFMRYALFAGCKTGRVLVRVFGTTLIEHIEFEETTREVAGDPKTIYPAQPEHIKAALEFHKPVVVIAFGSMAQAAVAPLWEGKYIHAHHPASRHKDTPGNLIRAQEELRVILKMEGWKL